MDIPRKSLIVLTHKYGNSKDLYIQIPKEINWEEGDTINWEIQEDNSVILKNSRIIKEESVHPYNIKEVAIKEYLDQVHLNHEKDFYPYFNEE